MPLDQLELADLPRPLIEHLGELRSCLVHGLAGWFLATLCTYGASGAILRFLIRPPIAKLAFLSPAEPFFAYMKIAFISGFIVSFPWLLFQAWRFVAPGLKQNERAVLLKLIPASYCLFLLGGIIGLFGAAPICMKFLLSYGNDYLIPYITLNAYLSYVSYLALGTGILFQLPLVLFILGLLGLIGYRTLGQYRRHVFLGILIVAAIITPSPDIFGQLMIALPTYVLYELAILAVWLTQRQAAPASPIPRT